MGRSASHMRSEVKRASGPVKHGDPAKADLERDRMFRIRQVAVFQLLCIALDPVAR